MGSQQEHHFRDEIHDIADAFEEAAVAAEFETGRREETVKAAKRHLLVRFGRVGLGAIVVIIGIILLPLPGPGMLVIAAGLALLSADVPFARRWLQEVQQRLPRDQRGKVPWWTFAIMGMGAAMSVGFSLWWSLGR